MLTLFTIPKPFQGPIGIIQRNAIQSWKRLDPSCEVLLFGDEEGTEAVADQLGATYIPHVERNEMGTPLLHDVFEKAEKIGTHPIVAYVNTDIMLTSHFLEAIRRLPISSFLMVGRRWDVDITETWDFTSSAWEQDLLAYVDRKGKRHSFYGIDYFVFPKGALGKVPPFAVGRPAWDNWLIYRVRSRGIPVIDASSVVRAIHQNHDYSHHPEGQEGVWKGEERDRNYELAGPGVHFTMYDATRILTASGLRYPFSPIRLRQHLKTLCFVYPKLYPWFLPLWWVLFPIETCKRIARRVLRR